MVITGEETVDTSEASPWSFQAGNLALDFANTVDWHASQNPDELLTSYTALVNWSRDFGVLQDAEAESLHAKASRDPGMAAETLAGTLILREAIYRIFHAVAHREAPGEADLEILKETQARAISAARLMPKENGFRWNWSFEPPDFEQVLWPVAQAAVDLLLSKNITQVGQCADERGCGALFIDTSRNHSRQWCSMDACGNRAKAQRHYNRYRRTIKGTKKYPLNKEGEDASG